MIVRPANITTVNGVPLEALTLWFMGRWKQDVSPSTTVSHSKKQVPVAPRTKIIRVFVRFALGFQSFDFAFVDVSFDGSFSACNQSAVPNAETSQRQECPRCQESLVHDHAFAGKHVFLVKALSDRSAVGDCRIFIWWKDGDPKNLKAENHEEEATRGRVAHV